MTLAQSTQTALAAEHAALYVYGVLGGRVSASAQPVLARRLAGTYGEHRGQRDELISMVRATGLDPVAASTSYELPNRARTASELERAALVTEQRCAAVYGDTVAGTSGATRNWAIGALVESAVRQLGFGGEPTPFPGISEL